MFNLIPETHFDFMGKRRIFYVVSAATLLIGIVGYFVLGGFKIGIDFAGGRLIEIKTSQPLPVEQVRDEVADIGFPAAEIQRSGQGDIFLIRIPDVADQKGGAQSPSALLRQELQARTPGLMVELLREENIGAKIGHEIRNQAILANLIAWGLLLIYLAFRFEFWFGFGAVVAVIHDILITLVIFLLFGREITMTVIAALLTLAGYSINDKIVVFDRIREEMVRLRREPLINVMNISINRTLSRTLITGLSVFFTVGMLLAFGGPVLFDFALAIFVGLVVGTYSSIFVASALALDIRRSREAKTAS